MQDKGRKVQCNVKTQERTSGNRVCSFSDEAQLKALTPVVKPKKNVLTSTPTADTRTRTNNLSLVKTTAVSS